MGSLLTPCNLVSLAQWQTLHSNKYLRERETERERERERERETERERERERERETEREREEYSTGVRCVLIFSSRINMSLSLLVCLFFLFHFPIISIASPPY